MRKQSSTILKDGETQPEQKKLVKWGTIQLLYPDMELNQATVEQIPQVTKAEQEVNDLSSIQEAFGANQDVSGLDLNSRRTRKVQVNDIDEYIRQLEMETSLAEIAKSGEDQNAIIQGGIFKPRYQMKINLVDEPPKAPQNGRRRNTNLDEDEVQAEPEPSMSAKSTQRTVEDRSFIQPRYDWKSKSAAKSSRFSRLSTRTDAYTRKSFDPQASPTLYSECALGLYCASTPLELTVSKLLATVPRPLGDELCSNSKQLDVSRVSGCFPESVSLTNLFAVESDDTIYMSESLQDLKIFIKKNSITLLRKKAPTNKMANSQLQSPKSPFLLEKTVGELSPNIYSPKPTHSMERSPSIKSPSKIQKLMNWEMQPTETAAILKPIIDLYQSRPSGISYKLLPPQFSELMVFETEDLSQDHCQYCPKHKSTSATEVEADSPLKFDEEQQFALNGTSQLRTHECLHLTIYNTPSNTLMILVFHTEDLEDPDHLVLWRVYAYNPCSSTLEHTSASVVSYLESQMKEEMILSSKHFMTQLSTQFTLAWEKNLLQEDPIEPVRPRRRFKDPLEDEDAPKQAVGETSSLKTTEIVTKQAAKWHYSV